VMDDTSVYELVNPIDSYAINNKENVENIEFIDEDNGNDPKEVLFSKLYIFCYCNVQNVTLLDYSTCVE